MESLTWLSDLEPMWALTIILLGGNVAQWLQAIKERKDQQSLYDKVIAAMNEFATMQKLMMDRMER